MSLSFDDLDQLHAEPDDLLVRLPGSPDDEGDGGSTSDGERPREIDLTGLHELTAVFVAAYDAHDLDGILEVVADDVELPDLDAEGAAALTDELTRLWDRLPEVVLTPGWSDGVPCAVAWRPDDEGRWVRCGLVALELRDDLVTSVRLVDDAGALDLVVADEPVAWRRPELIPPDHDDD